MKKRTGNQNSIIKNDLINSIIYNNNISFSKNEKKIPFIKNYFIHNNIINNYSNDNNNNNLSSNNKEQIIKYKLSSQINLENNPNNLNSSRDAKNTKIEEYILTDFDDMDYDEAVRKDKRNFIELFYEKMKSNQIILNTFYAVDHLRPRTIKIMIFILDIDLYLFVNGLFFNEEYVSEVFHSKKAENFFTFIPRSIDRFFYTTWVRAFIGYAIDFFFVEEKKIKGIFRREKENLIIMKYEISKIIKNIQKRNKWFIILSFIIICITLYYIFCFNNIYPHMRNEWIKSSIIIIIIMQIIYLLACLLEAIMRKISFKCQSEKIFKISLLFS